MSSISWLILGRELFLREKTTTPKHLSEPIKTLLMTHKIMIREEPFLSADKNPNVNLEMTLNGYPSPSSQTAGCSKTLHPLIHRVSVSILDIFVLHIYVRPKPNKKKRTQ